jgi:hypothetical protein
MKIAIVSGGFLRIGSMIQR